jgi:hypothetical protein
VACRRCEYLERQYEDAVNRIRGEKVSELHRWQENRDDAIEAFYSHKRMHQIQIVKARDRNVA